MTLARGASALTKSTQLNPAPDALNREPLADRLGVEPQGAIPGNGEHNSRGTDSATRGTAPADAGFANLGRQRVTVTPSNRVRRDGKFFRLLNEKFYVKGFTYGPFAAGDDGVPLPDRLRVHEDFKLITGMEANCVRVYHEPPIWFLDLAQAHGLKIFVDVAWPKNLTFNNPQVVDEARQAVRAAARRCGNHPAVFALSVVNELPPDIVRFVGRRRVESFIDELVCLAREEAPQCLITFANFPTTEYLRPRDIDFYCFNLYLHDETVLRNYLARLQNIAGDKPLIVGEYGIDTLQEGSEELQAQTLAAHVRAVFDEGLAGTCIFSFTDDWFTGGWQISEWAFGVVRQDRTAKPAGAAVRLLLGQAPQLALETVEGQPLPMCSVIVCSYNGGSTVESCLRSMERLRYPTYEVIFVDDGSTDHTQEILKNFPWVRNIRQRNMGLSYARNVGLDAARGDIVVYTDSDCEADEDWLYYLALALVRSKHAGMGGPNLIPDEGSWVADAVGLAPGGPTHVMIDDRTAEHVPGCNMAFYTWAARQANGFDPQFRKAGDDVDFIWRLQHMGHSIGFAPSAQVWHYRRNTVKAYLRQQRGYGEAEALLKYKHPDHFNGLGASHWRGRIYGGDEIGVRVGSDVIYHGTFGTGLFQTIYRRPASMMAMMLMSVEWHLLALFVVLLGLALSPMFWVAGAMFMVPILLSMVAAIQAPMPRHKHWLSRPLIAWLHLRQPMARGWARYSVRLKAKVLHQSPTGNPRPRRLPVDPEDARTLRYWSDRHDRITFLQTIKDELRAAGWRMRLDSGWNGWDMEIYGSRYVKVRLTTATERHERNNLLTRVRVELRMSKFCQVLILASMMLAGLLLFHLWPLSRPAVLIPLAWWTMYVMNCRVALPVLALIDAAGQKAGFMPLLPVSKPVINRAGIEVPALESAQGER